MLLNILIAPQKEIRRCHDNNSNKKWETLLNIPLMSIQTYISISYSYDNSILEIWRGIPKMYGMGLGFDKQDS